MHVELTEDDFSLIHALQLQPRASWTDLSPILGRSAVTLARRWEHLTDRGLAWVTAYPTSRADNRSIIALVEVACSLRDVEHLSRELARFPEVATIEQAARDRNLILTILVRDLEALSTLILEVFPKVDGMESTRSHLLSRTFLEGSSWRLDALDGPQLQSLQRLGPTTTERPPSVLGDPYLPIANALAFDGRMSATTIAERINRPVQTVRRQLTTLIRSGAVTFRCEIAQAQTRTPVCVNWWCRLPSAHWEDALRRLRTLPELRLCGAMTGPTNFLITTWLSSLSNVTELQGWLERELAPIEIVDSSVTLRFYKRMGWLLHSDTRATGETIPFTAPMLSIDD